MKKSITPILGLTILLASTATMANEGQIKKKFQQMDTDSNNMISKTEFLAYSEKKFDMIDTNNDDSLSLEEKMAFKEGKMDKKNKDSDSY